MEKVKFNEFENAFYGLSFERKLALYNIMKKGRDTLNFYIEPLTFGFFNNYGKGEDVARQIADGSINWKHPYVTIDSDYKLLSLTKEEVEKIVDDSVGDIYDSFKGLEIKYYWKAECSESAFEDKSIVLFDTKEDCYNDMRNAVLEKMKWNTEYNEDFVDVAESIENKVNFSPNCITHLSYSGLYTYTIVEEIVL